MNDTFNKWDPILLKITDSHPAFLLHLIEELVSNLIFDDTKDSNDAQAEAIFMWLTHILTSPVWKLHKAFVPYDRILLACNECSNHWAKALGDVLREPGNITKGTEKSTFIFDSVPEMIGVSQFDSFDGTSSTAKMLQEHGWEPVRKWDSRSLGVASTS